MVFESSRPPATCSRDELLEVFERVVGCVRRDDSAAGTVSWEWSDTPGQYDVTAVFRTGNQQGQGSVVILDGDESKTPNVVFAQHTVYGNMVGFYLLVNGLVVASKTLDPFVEHGAAAEVEALHAGLALYQMERFNDKTYDTGAKREKVGEHFIVVMAEFFGEDVRGPLAVEMARG